MRSGFFTVGLLVGALVGVVAAFFFAPEATDQLRSRLRPTSSDFKNNRVETVADTVEYLDDQRIILDRGKTLTSVGDS